MHRTIALSLPVVLLLVKRNSPQAKSQLNQLPPPPNSSKRKSTQPRRSKHRSRNCLNQSPPSACHTSNWDNLAGSG